jgi:hypothetical protein
MKTPLRKGLKETSILNPSDFDMIPLDITGFMILEVSSIYLHLALFSFMAINRHYVNSNHSHFSLKD